MYTTLFSAALFTAAALQGVHAQETYHSDFAVNQPELVVGKSAKISWQPTEGPYNILIVPEDDPCNGIVADLGDHDTTFFEWQKVDAPAGKKVLISIQDKNGNEGWSRAIDVKPAEQVASSAASSAAASASEASSSSTGAATVDGTTLVVPPTASTSTRAGSAPASSSPSASIVAVGAAGDGIINTGKGVNDNGALSAVAVSVPALALAALGAVLVL